MGINLDCFWWRMVK